MKPYKTLIVEDNLAIIEQLEGYLKDQSILNLSHIAKSCDEAMDILIENSFEVSILDIELPDGKCFDILENVPKHKFGELVFCTEFGGENMEALVEAQPIAYMPKPFKKLRVQQMLLKVEEYLLRKEDPIRYVVLFTQHRAKKILVAMNDILYVDYNQIDKKITYHYKEDNPDYIKEISENQLGKINAEITKENIPRYLFLEALCTGSLADQMKKLNKHFVYSNRNCIINLDYLKEFKGNKEGFDILMPDGNTVELTKGFRKEVQSRKGFL